MSRSIAARPALTRHRSSRHSSPLQHAVVHAAFIQKLRQNGLACYVTLFQAHNLPQHALESLSNAELRDDLHISILAHRRKILSLAQPPQPRNVPLFGAILVHLSNVRTCHSWLRLTFQTVIFALAISRLGVLRNERASFGAATAVCCLAAFHALYGGWRYLSVTRRVESGERFSADTVGTLLALAIALCIAAGVLFLILHH